MQIVSIGDNLHEMSNPIFGKNKKKMHEMSNPILGKNKKIFQYLIC